MSNEILSELLSEYDKKKLKAELDLDARKAELYKKLPRLQEIEDEGDVYESIEDLWPDYPTKEDFLFNEDEY